MELTALTFAVQVLGQLPQLIVAGVDVLELVRDANDSLKKMMDEDRPPTDEEWDAMNALIEDLRAQRPDVSQE